MHIKCDERWKNGNIELAVSIILLKKYRGEMILINLKLI